MLYKFSILNMFVFLNNLVGTTRIYTSVFELMRIALLLSFCLFFSFLIHLSNTSLSIWFICHLKIEENYRWLEFYIRCNVWIHFINLHCKMQQVQLLFKYLVVNFLGLWKFTFPPIHPNIHLCFRTDLEVLCPVCYVW